MSNPWKEQLPFAPMFCDVIKIDGTREGVQGFQSTVRACVFPIEDVEPFDQSCADSDVQSITVIVPKSESTGAPPSC